MSSNFANPVLDFSIISNCLIVLIVNVENTADVVFGCFPILEPVLPVAVFLDLKRKFLCFISIGTLVRAALPGYINVQTVVTHHIRIVYAAFFQLLRHVQIVQVKFLETTSQ